MRETLKVLVVDDHCVVLEGVRSMLDEDPSIMVIGEATTGEEAIQKVSQLEPDVVLMDIQLPAMTGIEATRRIKAVRPSTAVMLFTMYDSDIYVVEGLRAGAAGYLVKDSSRELLRHTIHVAVEGGTMVRSNLLRKAIQGLSRGAHHLEEGQGSPALREHLTEREMAVLRLVAQGSSNKEIAKVLGLAEITVKKYVQSLIGKMGASDRTQTAIMAFRLGLVE